MVFTTGQEVTRMVRQYGADSIIVETLDAGASYTVRITFVESSDSLRVYEVLDEDHAINLAQKLATRFNVELTLHSLVDEEMAYDVWADEEVGSY